MVIEVPPIILGGLAFFVIGGGWMIFYWRVAEPFLRRVCGRMLGATINRGEHNIWIVNNEPADSPTWRAAIIRPMQMAFTMAAVMVALVIGLAVTIWLSQ